MFVSYLPFFNSIFRQANTPFTQNQQYPTPFYLSVLYYHGNPRLLRESILLPDSTIFSPIAILSAASKNTKKRGPPPTVMNPTKPQNPLILSHSSILSPASTQNPMASFGNCRLCRCYTLMTFTPLYPIYPTQFDIRQTGFDKLRSYRQNPYFSVRRNRIRAALKAVPTHAPRPYLMRSAWYRTAKSGCHGKMITAFPHFLPLRRSLRLRPGTVSL